MPVSGFKKGDKVLTPAGKRGTVTSTSTVGCSVAQVRCSDGNVRVFCQAALRKAGV